MTIFLCFIRLGLVHDQGIGTVGKVLRAFYSRPISPVAKSTPRNGTAIGWGLYLQYV